MQGFVLALAVFTTAAADLPYVGRWKLNMAKSDVGNLSVVFERTPDAKIRTTTGAFVPKATFRFDGQDYPAEFGITVAWSQLDARTWTMTTKRDGRTGPPTTVTLSADERTLTIIMGGGRPSDRRPFWPRRRLESDPVEPRR
jgi:hypothetical protein